MDRVGNNWAIWVLEKEDCDFGNQNGTKGVKPNTWVVKCLGVNFQWNSLQSFVTTDIKEDPLGAIISISAGKILINDWYNISKQTKHQ